jgi:hypothetical protein
MTVTIEGNHSDTDYGLKFLLESTNKNLFDAKTQLMVLRAEAAANMSNWHNEIQATVHLTNQLIEKFIEACDDYRNAQIKFQSTMTSRLLDETNHGSPSSDESGAVCQRTELELLEKSLGSTEDIFSEIVVLEEFNPGNSCDTNADAWHPWNEWIKRIIVGSVAVTIVIIIITKVMHLSI